MRTIAFRTLNDRGKSVVVPRCNPFQVVGPLSPMTGGLGEVFTGLSLDMPDDFSLRVQPAHLDRLYVLSWRFALQSNELVLLVAGPSEDEAVFNVWIVSESVQPVRFANVGGAPVLGGEDA